MAQSGKPARIGLTQLGDPDPVILGAVLGRFLAAVQRLGDFLEALALAGQRAQLGDFVALSRAGGGG